MRISDQHIVTLYAVGRILKSFGIRGAVVVEPLTHSPERFKKLKTVYIGTSELDARAITVAGVQTTTKGIRMTLAELKDRTSADQLVGQLVLVDETNLLRPPRGSYFIHEIVGCEVWMDGVRIGAVTDVISTRRGLAQDVWVIETKDGERWFPAVKEFIERVDVQKRTIVVRRIDGLFE